MFPVSLIDFPVGHTKILNAANSFVKYFDDAKTFSRWQGAIGKRFHPWINIFQGAPRETKAEAEK